MTDDEFTEFARAHTPGLYRTAVMLCQDTHSAEDLVQETLAKIYSASVTRSGTIDHSRAFARTVLVRTFLSARRRRSSGETPTGTFPEAAYRDADLDLRLALSRALAGLPPKDRAVLVLRFLDDQSVAEVAETLRLTPGAVKTRTNRALARIRGLLDLTPEESRP